MLDNRGTVTIATGVKLWVSNLVCETGASVQTQTGSTLILSSGATTSLPCLVNGAGVVAFNATLVTIDRSLLQAANITYLFGYNFSCNFYTLFLRFPLTFS